MRPARPWAGWLGIPVRTGDHKPVGAAEAFRLMLRDRIGPALREAGFKGSSPTWTFTASRGDLALVNVQRSRWSPPGEVRFAVNLSVLPEPWWRWCQQAGLAGAPSSKPKEYHGLWRHRLRPRSPSVTAPGTAGGWWIVRDAASAAAAADDVIAGLRDEALPTLMRLTDRQELLAEVRGGGFIQGPVAVLLSDEGPSTELDAVLEEMATCEDEDMRNIDALMIPWCRDNASEVLAKRSA